MSALLEIRDKLRDTHAAVARLEAELATDKNDAGLRSHAGILDPTPAIP